jgi:hypothetical protein
MVDTGTQVSMISEDLLKTLANVGLKCDFITLRGNVLRGIIDGK